MDVPEPHVVERAELLLAGGHVREERERLLASHLEDVRDAFALVVDLQGLAVVAIAAADLARDIDVGEELHLDLDDPVAGTGLAATALHVEREAARGVAAEARLRHGGEELAYRREEAGVRRGVRARRSPDRRLVDLDDLVDVLDAFDAVVRAGPL